MRKVSPVFLGSFVFLLGAGCGGSSSSSATEAKTSRLTIRTLAHGPVHDVVAIRIRILPAGSSCDESAVVLAEETVALEDLPSADQHAFTDALFVLAPGDYRASATPLAAGGTPSTVCAAASADVTVVPEITTEVSLVSQCQGDSSGGIDVPVTLNDPPRITDLQITPSKFITACGSATMTVQAADPNGDPLTYTWEMVFGPGGSLLSPDGATATFRAVAAGDYQLRVTVADSYNATARLQFPIHVAPGASACAAIDQQGGTISLPGGASLVVPPGALERPVVISIVKSGDGHPTLPPPAQAAADDGVWEIQPHVTFAVPATLRIPVGCLVGARLYSAEPGGEWVEHPDAVQEYVPGSSCQGFLVAQVTDLSFWSALKKAATFVLDVATAPFRCVSFEDCIFTALTPGLHETLRVQLATIQAAGQDIPDNVKGILLRIIGDAPTVVNPPWGPVNFGVQIISADQAVTKPWLRPGYGANTLGESIVLDPLLFEALISHPDIEYDAFMGEAGADPANRKFVDAVDTLVHELVHVGQYASVGLNAYLTEYLLAYVSAEFDYVHNHFEVEAYTAAALLCDHRNGSWCTVQKSYHQSYLNTLGVSVQLNCGDCTGSEAWIGEACGPCPGRRRCDGTCSERENWQSEPTCGGCVGPGCGPPPPSCTEQLPNPYPDGVDSDCNGVVDERVEAVIGYFGQSCDYACSHGEAWFGLHAPRYRCMSVGTDRVDGHAYGSNGLIWWGPDAYTCREITGDCSTTLPPTPGGLSPPVCPPWNGEGDYNARSSAPWTYCRCYTYK